ncbi:MAG TPA: sortase [Candidatus Paceibacterota bacterium]|nr:sortase [Candidatus Paceibacterota bacterium]
MHKSNHKLVSIIFSVAIIIPVSGMFFSHTNAQSAFNFVRDLTLGSKGDDVKALQQFLNSNGARVSASGFGSPGNETAYFGVATRAALAKWQADKGIFPPVGYFGPKTRSFIAAAARDIVPSSSPLPLPITAPVPLTPGLGWPDLSSGGQDPQQANQSLPIRLKIPKINVDAPIISVGITSDGTMGVPKGPAEVAWFDLGPRPGEVGSAVIAGHFGPWKSGGGSVFDDLNKLSKGDKLYVDDGNGTTFIFVVREIRILGKNDDGSVVFNSSDGKAHLNLVTCEGTWDKVLKTYSNRLVVFADEEIQ